MANDKAYDRHINIWINGKEVKNDISSIKKEMLNLTNQTAKATVGSDEYNQKASELRKVKAILKEHQENISATGGAWSKLKETVSGSLGKITGLIGIIVGAYESAKGVITSTEGLSDKFNELLSGGKEVFWQFQRSIATLDFSNFFENMKEAWIRGKELEQQLDDLVDKKAYNDYLLASKNRESRALQETIKNAQLDISIREKAADERLKIEKEIYDRTVELSGRAFLIEKQQWEDRNKMNADEAVKLYETIDSYSVEIQTKLSDAFKQAKDDMSPMSSFETLAKRVKHLLPEITVGAIEAYGNYLKLLKTGEGEVLPKLFNSYKNIAESTAEAQLRLNAATKEWSAIKNKDDKANGGTNSTLSDENAGAKQYLKSLDAYKQYSDAKSKVDEFGLFGFKLMQDKQVEKTKESGNLMADANDEKNKRIHDSNEAIYKDVLADIAAEEERNRIAEQSAQKLLEAKRRTAQEAQNFITVLFDRQESKLDEQYKKDIAAAGDNANLKVKIEEDYAKKKNALARRAAIFERAAALVSIGISVAKGITEATAAVIATFGASLLLIPWIIAAGVAQAAAVVVKPIPSFSGGGFTEPGGKYQPAGIVHAGEWVANADMVASPSFGPILQSLEHAQVNGMLGYANGGGPGFNSSGSGSSASSSALVGPDPELKQTLKDIRTLLVSLKQDGVRTIHTYDDLDSIRKGMSKLERIEATVRK